MNPEMDETRILAQLERRLAQDDPALAATMEALNQQFPDEPKAESADGHEGEEKQRNWWVTAAAVFTVIAFLGLFITAVLNSNPNQDTGPPRGPGTGVSTQSERRSPPRTPPRQRLPGRGTGLLPDDPPSQAYISITKDAAAMESESAVGRNGRPIEIAELTARAGGPLIAVVERPDDGPSRVLGVITAVRLLERPLQGAHPPT